MNSTTTEEIKPDFRFNRNLFISNRDPEVKLLQEFLNSSGFKLTDADEPGAPGRETNFFGRLTKAAIIKFQENYDEEILKPLDLTKGTGYFGPSSRKMANKILDSKNR